MTTITLHQHVTASTMLCAMITAVRAKQTVAMETIPAFCSITPPMRRMELFRLGLFFDPKTQALKYSLILRSHRLSEIGVIAN